MGHQPPPPPHGQVRYPRSISPAGSRQSTDYDPRDPRAHSRGGEYPQHRMPQGAAPEAGYRDQGMRRHGREGDEQSSRSQNRDYPPDADHDGRRLEQLSLSGSHNMKVSVHMLGPMVTMCQPYPAESCFKRAALTDQALPELIMPLLITALLL